MVLGGGLALAVAGPAAGAGRGGGAYGMIGAITATPGQRAALATILLSGGGTLPGCRSYIVAEDVIHPDKLWIVEIWDSKAAHDASLKLPQVREAITKGRPLIAGFETTAELKVLGDAGVRVG